LVVCCTAWSFSDLSFRQPEDLEALGFRCATPPIERFPARGRCPVLELELGAKALAFVCFPIRDPDPHELRKQIEPLPDSFVLRLGELFGEEPVQAYGVCCERPFVYGYINDETLALVRGRRLFVLGLGWSD